MASMVQRESNHHGKHRSRRGDGSGGPGGLRHAGPPGLRRGLRPGHARSSCSCWKSRRRCQGRRSKAWPWNSTIAASRRCKDIIVTDDAEQGVRGRATRPLLVGSVPAQAGHGTQGSARHQRQDLRRPGQGPGGQSGQRRAHPRSSAIRATPTAWSPTTTAGTSPPSAGPP